MGLPPLSPAALALSSALSILLVAARPARGNPSPLLLEPSRLEFDPAGFSWAANSSDPRAISLPGWRRLRFEFLAPSEEPCPEVRKSVRVRSLLTGRPLAMPQYVPAGAADAWGTIRLPAPSDPFAVSMMALVRLQQEPQGVSTWAVAETGPLHEGP